MLFKSIAVAALLAVTVQAKAHPEAMMPLHEAMGLGARDSTGPYQPTQSFCNAGATCAEACGAGFETCPSSDQKIHCYNQGAGSTCCSDMSGNSCDAGYYCAGNPNGETLCCLDGMDLAACAAANSVTGTLSSETPLPTTTSTSSTSTISSSSMAPQTTTSMTTMSRNTTSYNNQSTVSSTISGSVNMTSAAGVTTPALTAAAPSSTAKSSAGVVDAPARAVVLVLTGAFAVALLM